MKTNKEYYHLEDTSDGDFIAMDTERNLYKMAHDPFEITILKGELVH